MDAEAGLRIRDAEVGLRIRDAEAVTEAGLRICGRHRGWGHLQLICGSNPEGPRVSLSENKR